MRLTLSKPRVVELIKETPVPVSVYFRGKSGFDVDIAALSQVTPTMLGAFRGTEGVKAFEESCCFYDRHEDYEPMHTQSESILSKPWARPFIKVSKAWIPVFWQALRELGPMSTTEAAITMSRDPSQVRYAVNNNPLLFSKKPADFKGTGSVNTISCCDANLDTVRDNSTAKDSIKVALVRAFLASSSGDMTISDAEHIVADMRTWNYGLRVQEANRSLLSLANLRLIDVEIEGSRVVNSRISREGRELGSHVNNNVIVHFFS